MSEQTGLRERKKRRTYENISDTALALFAEHGYDQVSITQVAEAAEVSRRTLFSYFPTKEDLIVCRLADHETESARVVRARPAGLSPLTALREHYLDGLARRDPITGLSELEPALVLYRVILGTPSLVGGMFKFKENGERALAAALRETADLSELTARLAAAQIMAVTWMLSLDNRERVLAGTGVDDAYPDAVAAAEQGFDQLAGGLGAALGVVA
ncbi:TetR family transcriptional regulator [Umezawaea sp. Da 62-37]|uniref:TetR/AcrR family transcriptional regulator n=1 Tax=Umezawaea sp. Da 62-37 TaxID=3075927 RepID=UPI0028F73978|nr:TetR family transcriptional regulator [Umezawaea sp. Da 62-37]WNV88645.1 TetR family transcriptional regulator [Umezawaea sp. Da 62-37]